MRQRSSDNWNFRAGTWDALKTELIDFEGDWPVIGSPSTPDFQGVCTANDYKAYSASGLVSMFVDDYILERFWNKPEKYTPKMRGCAAVMSPDFSLFIGMPEPMLRWNVYRNRLVGYVWEKAGAVVVPTISWADEGSFEYCFEGVRKGSVVAVSNTGCKTAEHRAFFDRGYQAMISALAPSKILFQCSGRFRADYQAENVIFIDSFFQKKAQIMGGRSGQSIARAASASEDAPDKGITIVGGGLSDAMQRQVEKAVRGQGVTGDVLVTFERIRGSTGGFVGWDAPVNSDDRTTSIFKIKPHIRINRSGYTDQQIVEIAKHEAQHIKQSQSGRFYIRKNYSVYGAEMRQRTKLSEDIYWEGKEYISSGAYASIMKKMGSKDPKIRALAYKKYRDLPWEVEAHAAGDPFK